MKINRLLMVGLLALGLGGCFTVSQTEYPAVQISALPAGREIALTLTGFEATVTSLVPLYGMTTVFDHGPMVVRGRHGWYSTYSSGVSTYATQTMVPQVSETKAYFQRAKETLEKAGFVLESPQPKYRVEVHFSGPYVTLREEAQMLSWMLFSIFTADCGIQTWKASLRIHDLATGKLVQSSDYEQRYRAVVWGPLPIFSPSFAEETQGEVIKAWCLTALTDRALADASAFLKGH